MSFDFVHGHIWRKRPFQKFRFRKYADFHKLSFDKSPKKVHLYSCMKHMLTIYFSEVQFEHISKTDIVIYPRLIFWKATLRKLTFGIFSKCHWTYARSYNKERSFGNVVFVSFENVISIMKRTVKIDASEIEFKHIVKTW